MSWDKLFQSTVIVLETFVDDKCNQRKHGEPSIILSLTLHVDQVFFETLCKQFVQWLVSSCHVLS